MKKLFSILLVATLVLSGSATSAFAASTPHSANYLDADHDGICDVCGAEDADHDGICDNCLNGGLRSCSHDGTGRHSRYGRCGGRK